MNQYNPYMSQATAPRCIACNHLLQWEGITYICPNPHCSAKQQAPTKIATDPLVEFKSHASSIKRMDDSIVQLAQSIDALTVAKAIPVPGEVRYGPVTAEEELALAKRAGLRLEAANSVLTEFAKGRGLL